MGNKAVFSWLSFALIKYCTSVCQPNPGIFNVNTFPLFSVNADESNEDHPALFLFTL